MSTLTKTNPQMAERPVEQRFIAPPVDIREDKDAFILVADMPGVDKRGITVRLDSTDLTVTGERTVDYAAGEELHRESARRSYRRTFEIAPEIDSARISARVSDGVLTLTLPKAEAVKPLTIAVTD
jgi:HSP20 family protein